MVLRTVNLNQFTIGKVHKVQKPSGKCTSLTGLNGISKYNNYVIFLIHLFIFTCNMSSNRVMLELTKGPDFGFTMKYTFKNIK